MDGRTTDGRIAALLIEIREVAGVFLKIYIGNFSKRYDFNHPVVNVLDARIHRLVGLGWTQFFHIGFDPLVLSNGHEHVKIRARTLCTKLPALVYLPAQ
jgi:hypothetical protein